MNGLMEFWIGFKKLIILVFSAFMINIEQVYIINYFRFIWFNFISSIYIDESGINFIIDFNLFKQHIPIINSVLFKQIINFFYFIKFDINLIYSALNDLFCIDNIFYIMNKKINSIINNNNNRFELKYYFFSRLHSKIRIFFSFFPYYDRFISISKIFSSSVWSEREVWDLFGFIFMYSIDHRRILTDYGFKGYPMRKDFPLSGFIELYYNDYISKIEFKNVCI